MAERGYRTAQGLHVGVVASQLAEALGASLTSVDRAWAAARGGAADLAPLLRRLCNPADAVTPAGQQP